MTRPRLRRLVQLVQARPESLRRTLLLHEEALDLAESRLVNASLEEGVTRASLILDSWASEDTKRSRASLLEVEVLPNAAAAAERGAEYVAECARDAVADRGRFTFAVSGGRAVDAMLQRLYGRMPWEKVTIYQVDERIVPDDDPERNLRQLKRSLPPGGAADIHATLVGAHDLEGAAAAYARSLPPNIDLVHLEIGPDGHTASLVPGDPVLDVTDRDVALTEPYMGLRRMTLTYPVLNRARHLLWLITGDDNADALRRMRAGDRSIPASRVATDRAIVFADAAAAGEGAS